MCFNMYAMGVGKQVSGEMLGLLCLGSGVIAGIVIINGLTMCLILVHALSFSLRELTNFSYLREKSSKSNLIRNGG